MSDEVGPAIPLPASAPPPRPARGRDVPLYAVLGYQVAAASVVTLAVFERMVGEPYALRPVEFSILALIDSQPRITSRQLATALSVSAPHIAAFIARLERRALIHREQGESDKRRQHLTTTAEGARVAAEATAGLLEEESRAWPQLSRAERGMLVELLQKLASRRPTTGKDGG